ncbi:hypothetical protein AB0L34_29300 [Micromonospora sp. NPDC052213]|uniref:hypothetical protein n=1 Tax=Micromonospora sp. NPDC052213 TaxID=3155812 RepID=UPI0034416760
MSRLRHAAESPHKVPQGRLIPLTTLVYLLISAAVTGAAHQFPEAAVPMSLGLATFLALERLHLSVR